MSIAEGRMICKSRFVCHSLSKFGEILPEFFPTGNISTSEEGHMRESRVLMFHEDLDGDEIGRAVVIDESGDVAVLVGVNTKGFATILKRKIILIK